MTQEPQTRDTFHARWGRRLLGNPAPAARLRVGRGGTAKLAGLWLAALLASGSAAGVALTPGAVQERTAYVVVVGVIGALLLAMAVPLTLVFRRTRGVAFTYVSSPACIGGELRGLIELPAAALARLDRPELRVELRSFSLARESPGPGPHPRDLWRSEARVPALASRQPEEARALEAKLTRLLG